MSNKYFRQYLSPAADAEETIYTVPDANTAIVSSLRVTNADTASAQINVTILPTGESTGYKVLTNRFVPVNATMDVFSGVSCVLQAGDRLKVKASQTGVDFYLSYLEIDRT